MAVRDIVAGAEMFLRTAGVADENMRRMLLQRIQEQAFQKSQFDIEREKGFQQYATEFMSPKMPDVSGASGYVPQGVTPQGMTQQPSMMSPEFMQGAMKFLKPEQAVTALTALETRDTPQDKMLRTMIMANAAKEREASKEPNPYETYYRDKRAQGWSDGQIIQGWQAEQLKLVQERYPPEVQGRSDLPPWITFNRIKGEYTDRAGNVLTDQDLKDAYVIQSGLKAGAGSIRNQAKIADMMGGFVRNMNKQITKVEQMMQDTIRRVGVRALDLPIRELNKTFLGSGHEKVLDSYSTEISNEIAKLSTGSSASIAELSVEAQKRWNKIHDPSLSFNEYMKVLNATKEQGNMRYESSIEQINATTERMSGSPTEPGAKPTPVSPSLSSGGSKRFKEGNKVYNIPADKIEAFKAKHPKAQEVR